MIDYNVYEIFGQYISLNSDLINSKLKYIDRLINESSKMAFEKVILRGFFYNCPLPLD